jgi:hypothetical protein
MGKNMPHEPKNYHQIRQPHGEMQHKESKAESNACKNVNILPKERMRSGPEQIGRHEQFQFGTNPMAMTAFEKELVHKEKEEREAARNKYIAGVQGRDGDGFPHRQFDEQWPDLF